MHISKNIFIMINILLILLEIVLVYLVIKAFLTNDFLSPIQLSIMDYLKLKLGCLI